jgi:hypothetical protein
VKVKVKVKAKAEEENERGDAGDGEADAAPIASSIFHLQAEQRSKMFCRSVWSENDGDECRGQN